MAWYSPPQPIPAANSGSPENRRTPREPFLPGYEANNQTAHFDRAAFDAGTHSTVYVNAPAGLQFPPLRGTHGRSEDGRTNKYHDNAWWHFAPRLGFAIDPSG